MKFFQRQFFFSVKHSQVADEMIMHSHTEKITHIQKIQNTTCEHRRKIVSQQDTAAECGDDREKVK